MVDPNAGELIERRLEHEKGDEEKFYGTLSEPARVMDYYGASDPT